MKFQSKYRNHSIVVRSATFEHIPGAGRRPIPGLVAKFRGPQRIFDPDQAAREYAWKPGEKEIVEDWLLNHPKFMIDFFPAPGEQIPEEKEELVQRKPAAQLRRCQKVGVENGEVVQCPLEATAGRDFCHDHDPENAQIIKGPATTID